jgi:hypothetical protein
MQEAVRWNLTVSKDTDRTIRKFLDEKGAGRGELSRFVEEAVRTQLFHCSILEIKSKNSDTAPEELQAIIDQAVDEVRHSKSPARSRR